MTQRAWCDGCRKQVDAVGTGGLCIPCYFAVRMNALITKHTSLTEQESFSLTRILHETILSALVQRLRVPGLSQTSLADELDLWMAPRPEKRH